ncbi:MAG: SWIM zinc finger family protein, partial [Anaerolineales bacterium]|nr:SWIM zinc finger family protein [Anaerolineales bacterium]
LVAALRAAGARLVESVEGWSRVCRITNYELRITNGEVIERPGTVEEAVEQMVAKGQEARPALAVRLKAAGALVREGRVELDGDEARLGPYTITAEGCTCRDFQYRGGWCKHRLAVRMARHLVANGFALPQAREEEPAPQISAANRALIGSGRVVDKVQRQERAYRESTHGARSAALRLMANGATTLPADLARRAGITNYERQVLNDDGGRQ